MNPYQPQSKALVPAQSLKNGKFRSIAEGPANIGFDALQMSVAKVKGKRASYSAVAGPGLASKLCCRNAGMFPRLTTPHLDDLSPFYQLTALKCMDQGRASYVKLPARKFVFVLTR